MSVLQVHVGIDLGSTTTKAVVLDASGEVIGRGITNNRSNYDVACQVVHDEALTGTRFSLIRKAIKEDTELAEVGKPFLAALERNFRLRQYLDQLVRLREALQRAADEPRHHAYRRDLQERVDGIVDSMMELGTGHFSELAVRKSDFFRDLATADYMHLAEQRSDPRGISFDILCSLFDAAILAVDNSADGDGFVRQMSAALDSTLERALPKVTAKASQLRRLVEATCSTVIDEVATVGTGYGRQRLPFPKEQIRSEILCHGLGAHAMFPGTRTVLDIGGQDTKAIQVDADGIVVSFQMNDRCAAGCGRYLGYIADEMKLGLHELGPLAEQSHSRVKINSTCTVFAGAELRERLSLGQRREDILAGLHRAIILRAMSLLARSGGINNEFTFTGGVARNPAAVNALRSLVNENYGERVLNISPDSIYTGALGAALFALRRAQAIA
ncbi:MAG TPA: BadF/BadG/BcrA/BcrD ATPase family protein [Terriglobales bacterium]|nr:BadF/BadG/BcrA/BcrD ATPase family protein [Terriglobales bacterium]